MTRKTFVKKMLTLQTKMHKAMPGIIKIQPRAVLNMKISFNAPFFKENGIDSYDKLWAFMKPTRDAYGM